MLNVQQLYRVTDFINSITFEEWSRIVIQLNRKEILRPFLEMVHHPEVHPEYREAATFGMGKILIAGDMSLKRSEVEEIFESLGIGADRLEMINPNEKLRKDSFKKTRYNPNGYAAIFMGPIPHKVKGMKEYPSIILQMEREDGYPPVYRLVNSQQRLHISKTNLRDALRKAIERRDIIQDLQLNYMQRN